MEAGLPSSVNAKIYGALDVLLDGPSAYRSYRIEPTDSPHQKLLKCYGFLQAIYVTQDAAALLSDQFGVQFDPRSDPRTAVSRGWRNRAVGHPSWSRGSDGEGNSIIGYHDITPAGFTIYSFVRRIAPPMLVEPTSVIADNENAVSEVLIRCYGHLMRRERAFCRKILRLDLYDNFVRGSGYLTEKLFFEVRDPSRRMQALSHLRMIRKSMGELLSINFKPLRQLLPYQEIVEVIKATKAAESLTRGRTVDNEFGDFYTFTIGLRKRYDDVIRCVDDLNEHARLVCSAKWKPSGPRIWDESINTPVLNVQLVGIEPSQ